MNARVQQKINRECRVFKKE